MTGREMRKRRRRRRQKIKKIITTVFLLLFLVVIAGGAAFMIYTLKGGAFSSIPKLYNAEELFEKTLTSQKNLKAETFSQNLCIVKEDVLSLDSVSLEEGQEAMLLDLDDRKVLFSKSAYEKVYPASITKIMTSMLALKYGKMDETVTITEENLQLEEGSQVCGFQAGDKVTVDQLVHCLLVYSGNDAASALAGYIAGSTSAFVDMMNTYAAQLGCTGTHFTNPHGLHDENHYTTPYDIYLMLNEARKYPKFVEITQLPSYTVTYTRADGSQMSTSLAATDHYLTGEAAAPKDVTVLGGKTGTTSDAGNCLALLSQNAYGKPYVSIVMGAATKDLLYVQMNSLLQNINNY